MDPPIVQFSKQRGGHHDAAYVAWENPDVAIDNRVDLHSDSTYDITICLPENFEYRRMQLLQAKSETLYNAIEAAEAQLGENIASSARLLSDEARLVLINDLATVQGQIDALKVDLVKASGEASRQQVQAQIDGLIAGIEDKQEVLQQDDAARDGLLPPAMVESLVNEIEDWRAQLNDIKASIVALRLMAENTNLPYPRLIRGQIETFDVTPFTEVGAIPFSIEDEYLEWIRQDKVVTIVAYDPNEKPELKAYADYRAAMPSYWPKDNLYVVEFQSASPGNARAVHGGLSPSTTVRQSYFNVSASTFQGPAGYERTYLKTPDEEKMWVFGPDLTPPQNVEVWLQDKQGLPVQKIYPPDARTDIGDAFVRQIAGVEGGAFDPVVEAKKRGQVVSITRIGSVRDAGDHEHIYEVHKREIERAQRVVSGS
ncbi:MAG: hypothetical protein IT368_18270 [Candidatus Hydrogenedentes bacterium]|nr:hypothetical protein [Candidatus Hydrogenedentota bacterium]